jgi:sugar phosphate isomerase/epimerase
MTSFSTLGVTWFGFRLEPLRRSDGSAFPAEVYLLMEKEVEKWRQRFKMNRGTSAVDFLAQLSDSQLRNLASDLNRNTRSFNTEVCALASFIPELTSNSTRSNVGRRAFANVLRFARILQKDFNHPVRVVELVAGSRIDRLWTGKNPTKTDEDQYFVQLFEPGLACNQMVSSLKTILETCLAQDPEFNLMLGLELEPGPYFTLDCAAALERFAQALAGDDVLAPRVGFNLDVSHFRLARISPDWVRNTSAIRQRVTHVHLSGTHPRGHLGDAGPLDVNVDADFEPWIRLIHEIASETRSQREPRFSGHVSLELEAARDEEAVKRAIEQMEKIFGDYRRSAAP